MSDEALLCCNCSKSLSVGPICFTIQEGVFCGRCPRPKEAQPLLAFEDLVRKRFFPCRFAPTCNFSGKFTEMKDHEDKCLQQPIRCSIIYCEEDTTLDQLQNHLEDAHQSLQSKKSILFWEPEGDLRKSSVLVGEAHQLFLSHYSLKGQTLRFFLNNPGYSSFNLTVYSLIDSQSFSFENLSFDKTLSLSVKFLCPLRIALKISFNLEEEVTCTACSKRTNLIVWLCGDRSHYFCKACSRKPEQLCPVCATKDKEKIVVNPLKRLNSLFYVDLEDSVSKPCPVDKCEFLGGPLGLSGHLQEQHQNLIQEADSLQITLDKKVSGFLLTFGQLFFYDLKVASSGVKVRVAIFHRLENFRFTIEFNDGKTGVKLTEQVVRFDGSEEPSLVVLKPLLKRFFHDGSLNLSLKISEYEIE